MVGSSFILINKNGRRTLLNTAQIISVNDYDILLTQAVRRICWEYPPEQEIGYMVQVQQATGVMNFMFTEAAERDALLDKIIAAVSPSTVIDSAPGLAHTWPEFARMGPPALYILDGKEYDNFEEYWKAWKEKSHKQALAHVQATDQSRKAAAQTEPIPPTPKPPRKPRTPRQ